MKNKLLVMLLAAIPISMGNCNVGGCGWKVLPNGHFTSPDQNANLFFAALFLAAITYAFYRLRTTAVSA